MTRHREGATKSRRLTRWTNTEEASPEEPSAEEDAAEGDDVEESEPVCDGCDSPSVAYEDPSQVNPSLPSVPLCRSCILVRL